MTKLAQNADHEVYVVGLCLSLIVASAIPAIASATIWLSLLLLAVVWSRIIKSGSSQTLSGTPTIGTTA